MFPCFMFHKEKGEKIFQSSDELKAEGAGWVDSPAKLEVVVQLLEPKETELSPSLDEELGKVKTTKKKKVS